MSSEIIYIVITLISIIVTIWFGLKNYHLKKRNLELEENKEEIRKKFASKAQLQAYIEDRGRQGYRLVIENVGDCEARNIIIKMDDKPFEDHCAHVKGDDPIQIIGAHSSVTKPIPLTRACHPPFELEIFWEDDSGEKRYYRTTLTF